MAPRGRPSECDKERIRQAGILCRRGFTNLEIAEFFGVDEKTIYNWQKKNPDFFQALKDNKDQFDTEIEEALAKRAKGFFRIVEKPDKFGGVIECKEEVPPDTTAGIFWLKNRKPKEWRDKQEIDTGENLTTAILELASGKGKQG